MMDIHDAADEENVDEVVRLIKTGVNVNEQDDYGLTPLHYAARSAYGTKKHLEVMEILIKAGVDINAHSGNEDFDDGTPLHYAAVASFYKGIELLIANGADINRPCRSNGWSPLHTAVTTNDPKVVQLLLDKGANPNLKNNDSGVTPIEQARDCSYEKLLAVFKKYGYSV